MDIIETIEKLKQHPEDLHWFCPRTGSDSNGLYFDEDLLKTTANESEGAKQRRHKLVHDANKRRLMVFDALAIFAFDGKDAEPFQAWLEQSLTKQLQRCEICIREFHRERSAFKERLESQYEEEQVVAFLDRFDQINKRRIKTGLQTARDRLLYLPSEKRDVGDLGTVGLFAIFESLNCSSVLSDQDFLARYLDEPFALVQTKRRLRLNNYTPAMTAFLFQGKQERLWWAQTSWTRFKRNVTASEFQWGVSAILFDAMLRVQLTCLDRDFLPMFWSGVRHIVSKLDGSLVTHSLRALDIDICRLALDHLQIDSDGFLDLLLVTKRILEIAPADFWDSMSITSASVWIEQFFSSPALKRLAKSARGPDSQQPLAALFGWMSPFLTSSKSIHQAPSCRTMTDQLLTRFQTDHYAPEVNEHCSTVGLRLLAVTMKSIRDDDACIAARAPKDEILDTIHENGDSITAHLKRMTPHAEEASMVMSSAIALDCRCLSMDYRLLVTNKRLPQNSCSISADVWRETASSLRPSNVTMIRELVMSTRDLLGMENFVVKARELLPMGLQKFNAAFSAASRYTGEILERISDAEPSKLTEMLEEQEFVDPFLALLFNANEDVRSAVVEVMKNMSGSSTRADAFAYVLLSNFTGVLDGLSRSWRILSIRSAYVPLSSSLRLCNDLIDILCNSENGLLKVQSLHELSLKAIEAFWETMWETLATIFNSTERWSQIGHDKEALQVFCRHVMELASKLFDQFPVFTSALGDSGDFGSKSQAAGKRLTDQPKAAAGVIAKWLRLRDGALLDKATALTCNILRRLKQFKAQVDVVTLEYVEGIVTEKIKTALNDNHKAELGRVLETYTGKSYTSIPSQLTFSGVDGAARTTKQREVIDIDKWKAKAKTLAPNQNIDDILAQSTTSADKFKAQDAARLKSQQSISKKATQDVSEFRKKREAEMAAKKKRDAEAVARLKRSNNPDGLDAQLMDQGSAITGLGVAGRDHTVPKGEGMMISSSESESDDEETEMDRELFGGLNKKDKTSEGAKIIAADRARRREMAKGPVKKQRLARSAKDMRARLAPDLWPLHKQILAWEYFHEDTFPPNSQSRDYSTVLSTFRDAVDYQRTFQPLLVLEAWSGFRKEREDMTSKPYDIKVNSRSTVDNYLEISCQVAPEKAKGGGVAEGDLILLSKVRSASTAQDDPHCLARVFRVSYKKNQCEVLYRTIHGTPMVSSLMPNTALFGLKVMSMIPLEREYGALLGLQYYDLCDEIAKAKPSPLLSYSDETLQPLISNYKVNKAQAKAIKSALDNDAFTLVQGPPGSGKTKTIVAIVGALLTETLRNPTLPTAPVPQQRSQYPAAQRSAPASKKLLVCAPSNAAADELVMRFKEGVKLTSGYDRKVNIVRLGRSDAINANVQDVTLDELVSKRLGAVTGKDKASVHEETRKVMERHKVISEQLRDVRAQLDDAEANSKPTADIRKEFDDLRRSKSMLGKQVDEAKDQEGAQQRQSDINRRKAQQEVVEEASIICATLSGSGHDMFQNLNIEFETVVIDEAAQCVELSALIPLKYGCAKCILVGDPQQLPPTIFSKDAQNFKYEQSVFVRMQQNFPKDVHLLDTQYRMHPDISAFPSRAFYDSRLLDGPDMASLRTRPWHATELLAPFRFFDVHGQQSAAPRGHSLINTAEIRVAMQLYSRLASDFKGYNLRGKIGIITPYRSQLAELKTSFRSQFGDAIFDTIEFNTTDAFQGRESEIIIFSCVRASASAGIGFLQDIRRMNVGLTRAKSSLWVLGNSQGLVRGEYWRKLVEDSQARGCYTSGDLGRMLSAPLTRSKEVTMVNDGLVSSEQTSRRSSMEIDVEPPRRINGTAQPQQSVNDTQPQPPQASSTLPQKRPVPSRDTSSSSSSSSSSASSSDIPMSDRPPSKPPAKQNPTPQINIPSRTPTPLSHSKPPSKSSTPQPSNGDAVISGRVEKPIQRRKKKEINPFIKPPARKR